MTGLALAWVLSWFGFDKMFITGMNELFGLHLTESGYYVSFFLVAVAMEIVIAVRNARTPKVVYIDKSEK